MQFKFIIATSIFYEEICLYGSSCGNMISLDPLLSCLLRIISALWNRKGVISTSQVAVKPFLFQGDNLFWILCAVLRCTFYSIELLEDHDQLFP